MTCRRRALQRRLSAVLVCLGAATAAGCSQPREAVRVESRRVVIENQTGDRWTDVEVWVNDHYRITMPALAAGGSLEAPLDVFVAGFGQRFDPRRQQVTGVEVSARSPAGERVVIEWGTGRRR